MEGFVNNTLGNRSILAKYSNSDIFLSLAAIFLTGGSCIEDANAFDKPRADKFACMPRCENVCCEATNRLSHNFTENSQSYRFCSADTILG